MTAGEGQFTGRSFWHPTNGVESVYDGLQDLHQTLHKLKRMNTD